MKKKYDFHCQALHLHENWLLNKSSLFYSRFHRLSALCAGMDDNSVKQIIRFLYFSALYWDSSDDELLVSPILAVPPETLVNFERAKPLLEKRFGIPKEDLYFEVFHSKLGISDFPDAVRDYMKNKVFLDCGAWVGDSALVMLEFLPSKILAFEPSPIIAEKFKKTMDFNKIPESKIELVLSGIGDHEYELPLQNRGNGSTHLNVADKKMIHIDSLDHLCRNVDRIGFIKADIEGAGLDMVRGMTEILKRDRPVLSLAIYHNPDEFFEIKPLLESLDLNYKFEISAHSYQFRSEIYLHAYPAELIE